VSYTLAIKRSAQKDLASLHPQVRVAVDRRILALADDPRPPGALALAGQWRGFWRVRAGDHRVIYVIDDQARTVTVAAVGPRESVY
jgi:mRNA interferase RelE/StbE